MSEEEVRPEAEVLADLEREVEAKLAEEILKHDEQAVWELSRREREALEGVTDADEREEIVQEVRVGWVREQRLQAEIKKELEELIEIESRPLREQVVRDAQRFYGKAQLGGGGPYGPSGRPLGAPRPAVEPREPLSSPAPIGFTGGTWQPVKLARPIEALNE